MSNIKKARYTLQMIAEAVTKKLNDAFKTSIFETMEHWIENQKVNPMFDYWFNVLRSIKIVFLIVRSFRELNIDILVDSREMMVPLFFSLDHVHYSRRVSVFIQDLKLLPVQLSSLYDEFRKGNFVVNTRGTRGNGSSKIAMNQAQAHNNKKIKSVSGYINLVNQEDKNSFKKLNYAGRKFISAWSPLRVVKWPKVTRRKPHRLLQHSARIVSRFMKIF